MRITSGVFGGCLLRTPRGIRPTQDRVRKSLFDILGDRVVGARVLDVFAGSGALGLEAISRGARWALFIEEDPRAVRVLLGNLERLGLIHPPEMGARVKRGQAVEVWRSDYRQALRRIRRSGEAYDLILMDPPYRSGILPVALRALLASEAVLPKALVVAEAEADLPFPEVVGLGVVDERSYGDTRLIFLTNTEGAAPGG